MPTSLETSIKALTVTLCLRKKTGMNHHGATESILCNSEATHTDLRPQLFRVFHTRWVRYVYIYVCTPYCNSQHEHNLDSSVATLVYHLVWNSQKDISSFSSPIFQGNKTYLVGGYKTCFCHLGFLFPIYGKSQKPCSKPPTRQCLLWENMGKIWETHP